nr:SpoIIE family protein phosphatase [bacterium]
PLLRAGGAPPGRALALIPPRTQGEGAGRPPDRQLQSVSGWMNALAGEKPAQRNGAAERQLARALASLGIRVRTVICQKRGDAPMTACVLLGEQVDPSMLEMIAQAATRAMGRDMSIVAVDTVKGGCRLHIGPAPRIRCRAGGAKKSLEAGQPSGDGWAKRTLMDGRVLLMLCDGMGTGKNAAQLTEHALQLLEGLIDMGIPVESALTGLNRLLAAGEEVRLAALDVLVIDPASQRAAMYKMGACPSILVREGCPQLIEGAALPMGAIEQGKPNISMLHLKAGDAIVLVSDGIWQALAQQGDGEEPLYGLRQALAESPGRAASRLVELAEQRAYPDDKSAVVLQVDGFPRRLTRMAEPAYNA